MGMNSAISEGMSFEVGLRHLLIMNIISFPLGPVVLLIVTKAMILPKELLEEVITVWLVTFVSGALQWLWIVPKAKAFLARVRKR